ncbi:MAG: hypothetical protein ABJH04_06315 [Cyclobacteriaceae bacterium]
MKQRYFPDGCLEGHKGVRNRQMKSIIRRSFIGFKSLSFYDVLLA